MRGVGNGEGQEAASLSKTHVAHSRTAACCMLQQQLRALIATLYAHFNGLSASLSHSLTASLSVSCSNLIAKSKTHSGIATAAGIGPQVLPPLGVAGFVKLRHVAADDKPSTSSSSSSATPGTSRKESIDKTAEAQEAREEAAAGEEEEGESTEVSCST